jgi:hypothetical protein
VGGVRWLLAAALAVLGLAACATADRPEPPGVAPRPPPPARDVAALQALLVRVARSLS